jgi:alpha-mannosidase
MGDSLPAEMLPEQVDFNGVEFKLAQAKTAAPNAIVARGQSIRLPVGHFDRVYVLAASANGDQKVAFEAGGKKSKVDVEDWGGFVGQWDDRLWSASDTSHDNYGRLIGLKPGFIKRADLAWYCSHHHNAAGQNVPYAYSYLFAYRIDVAPGTTTLKLPNNENVRILAISVANESAEAKPARPLYDVLPSPNAGAPDFSVATSSSTIAVPQGRSATSNVIVIPRGDFHAPIHLATSGLPAGITATFTPAGSTGSAVATFTAEKNAAPGKAAITITATGGDISRSETATLEVTPVLANTVPVDLTSAYNLTAIYKDGSKFAVSDSIDNDGAGLSAEQTGLDQVGAGVVFKLGPANSPDAVSGKTISLPGAHFSGLRLLAFAVNGSQRMQNFTVTYTDGTSSSFMQSLSDWSDTGNAKGESPAGEMAYRVMGDGSKDANPFYTHAYSFALEPGKTVKSISLPANRDVVVLGITLVPAA